MEEQKPQNPKLEQFKIELENLCIKFQYKLRPIIEYGPNGITPMLNVSDVPPPVVEDKKEEETVSVEPQPQEAPAAPTNEASPEPTTEEVKPEEPVVVA